MTKNLNKSNVRGEEQLKRMNLAESENICPFCPEGLIKIHKLPVEFENKNFFATQTAFPYDGVKQQYLIISKRHLTNPESLTGVDWGDIGECFSWIVKNKKINGSLFWRFGEMQKTGGTIAHFHMQIFEGNSHEGEGEEKRESIKIKLGYRKI